MVTLVHTAIPRGSCHSSHYLFVTMEEFWNFIATVDLFDIEAFENVFTWSVRRAARIVSARLDRVLANQGFLDLLADVELLNLPKLCSDHSPIQLFARMGSRTRLTLFASKICGLNMRSFFFPFIRNWWSEPLPQSNTALKLIMKLWRLKTCLCD